VELLDYTEYPKMNHIINCETGELTLVEPTAKELAEAEANKIKTEEQVARIEAEKAEAAAKKAAAEAKLAALGLDADDLKALGL
jgi:hypothetical protein